MNYISILTLIIIYIQYHFSSISYYRMSLLYQTAIFFETVANICAESNLELEYSIKQSEINSQTIKVQWIITKSTQHSTSEIKDKFTIESPHDIHIHLQQRVLNTITIIKQF